MVECSRGLVKLFGRMIPVPEEKGSGDGRGEAKDRCFEGSTATIKERDEEPPGPEEQSKQAAPSSIGNDEHRPSAPAEQETATTKSSDLEDGHNDACKRQDKNLKKPDKILPCPRCNSLDTKFCYYNNYNVNQPRHFCKKCQRYWTAGGAMRNVPVGAGRRRNKNAPAAFAHYRHMTISESSVQSLRPGAAELSYHPNGTILSFGCGMPPLCESVASAADSIAEKTLVRKRGDGIETSSGSPAICSSLREGAGITSQEPGVQNCHGYPQTNSCFNGSSWPYPCNSPTAIYAYWGCPPPGVWNVPWLPPLSSPPQGTAPPRLEPNLPLGKHSRDGTDLNHSSSDSSDAKQKARERCLWIPKSLRIDDLDEAARSSIWETVGIGNDRFGRISGEGLFKAFHPKADIKSPMNEKSQVLHSNPAALSRSLNFRESI